MLSTIVDRLQAGAQGEGAFMGGMLIAAAVALLTLIMYMRLRNRMAKRSRDAQTSPREKIEQRSIVKTQRNSLETLMVEVQELTRLCAAQMENRAVRLERLIAQADERLKQLEGVDRMARAPIGGLTEAPRIGVASIGSGSRPPYHASSTHSPNSSESAAGPILMAERDDDPLNRRVYELADAGRSSVEIAGELDEQVGKVELMLALRGR